MAIKDKNWVRLRTSMSKEDKDSISETCEKLDIPFGGYFAYLHNVFGKSKDESSPKIVGSKSWLTRGTEWLDKQRRIQMAVLLGATQSKNDDGSPMETEKGIRLDCRVKYEYKGAPVDKTWGVWFPKSICHENANEDWEAPMKFIEQKEEKLAEQVGSPFYEIVVDATQPDDDDE